jgi:hypothetical protein
MRNVPFKTIVTAWIVAAFLTACGGGGAGSDQVVSPSTSIAPVYMGIVSAMNDPESRVPAYFYHLPHSGAVEHEYFHLRARDVWSTATVNYDVSSQDPYEVLTWAQQAVTLRYGNVSPVSHTETAWYYESTWYAAGSAATHAHQVSVRAFKATALDRSMVDPAQPSALQGVVQQTPITAADASFLAEYLWTYSSSNNSGHVVVASNTVQTSSGFRHTIQEAVFNPQSSGTACVTVQLWDVHYDISNIDGSIVLSRSYQGEFHARLGANGGYIVCPDHAPQPATSGTTAQGIVAVYPQ